MAPSSPTDAATRKPSHLNLVIDGIRKKDAEIRPKILARRLSSADTSTMERSAPSSPGASNIEAWAPVTEMDEGSVERPEDICGLDEWDFEETMMMEDAGKIVWNGAEERERADHSLHDNISWQSQVFLPRQGRPEKASHGTAAGGFDLYDDDNATPASHFEDDAVGI
eukprot:CAMPEP_0180205714 /NCGR_PEP_ID=MMETSP0987-20121128/9150_1 /TAXON_ID=697907 /ORGANISM="non described non described, Strain CCMP2293" /LENGTH=167 /DNA_ID=CAMNT_0022161405 /DNA_START=56 /DNA_END=556 /DNA_ORIENTATION=-